MAKNRRIMTVAFQMNCPTHLVAGMCRDPQSQAWRYKDLSYWTELAQMLERGLFDAMFVADVLGPYDVFESSPAAALRAGVQLPVNDPMLTVSAMAHVTQHLGFGVTALTSFEHPYTFARRMSTLDHLTEGRIAWNIVTGYLDSAARNMGMDRQVGHDSRYEVADEFMEVVYKLWEGSWEDDAAVRDAERGLFAEPSKVHPIEHEGRYFKVPGIHVCEPSPQRTPLLFQAGASERGRSFAAQNAEATYVEGPTAEAVAAEVADIRARAREAGRDPYDIKVFTGFTVVTGATKQEAQQKHDRYRRYFEPGGIDGKGALALWSGWMGCDLSTFELDSPLQVVSSHAVQSMVAKFGSGDWTLRDLLERTALSVSAVLSVGDPVSVADEIQEWVEATDADGLNLYHIVSPGTHADFAEYVVPELQRRGVYRTEYDPGTLREKFFKRGSRLPESHPGARYRQRVLRVGE